MDSPVNQNKKPKAEIIGNYTAEEAALFDLGSLTEEFNNKKKTDNNNNNGMGMGMGYGNSNNGNKNNNQSWGLY